MRMPTFFRGLAQAAQDTARGGSIRLSNALQRFYERHLWLWSRKDRALINAALSCCGWATLAEQIVFHRRALVGLPAPKRLMIDQPTAAGLGLSSLAMPAYFMRAEQGRGHTRNRLR